jgi:fermentation-respiration switch protein FrsA (DUF1100 family)
MVVAPNLKRRSMTVLIAVGAGLIVAVVLIRVLENPLIFFPPRYPEGFDPPPQSYGLRPEEVWINAADGVRLNAWFFPAANSHKVLLCFHGNAENIGYGLSRTKVLLRLGANILALDYRGYGKSEGAPDEAGVYRDAEAAYRYLTETRGFDPRNIVIYGQSLGGAVAVDLASRRGCGGLIVESSFTSVREMARRVLLIPFLEYAARSRFDSLVKIAAVRAPILIIHGRRDEVVPFSMGRKLFEAAPEPKWFFPVEGAGHNDVLIVGGEECLTRLKSLIEAAPAAPATTAVPEPESVPIQSGGTGSH